MNVAKTVKMLKKNKSKETQGNGSSALVSHSLNSLVKGTKVEGDITSQSDIRIDGQIVGNLNCSEKLIIGPTGIVEGNVDCKCAVIEGSFDGILNVNELLSISETAKVSGQIRYNKLIVQPGAILVGDVRLINDVQSQPNSSLNASNAGKANRKENVPG